MPRYIFPKSVSYRVTLKLRYFIHLWKSIRDTMEPWIMPYNFSNSEKQLSSRVLSKICLRYRGKNYCKAQISKEIHRSTTVKKNLQSLSSSVDLQSLYIRVIKRIWIPLPTLNCFEMDQEICFCQDRLQLKNWFFQSFYIVIKYWLLSANLGMIQRKIVFFKRRGTFPSCRKKF